jgi:hypothetical protein
VGAVELCGGQWIHGLGPAPPGAARPPFPRLAPMNPYRKRRRRGGPVWIWALGFLLILALLIGLFFLRESGATDGLSMVDSPFTPALAATTPAPMPNEWRWIIPLLLAGRLSNRFFCRKALEFRAAIGYVTIRIEIAAVHGLSDGRASRFVLE